MRGWFDAFRTDGGPTLYPYSNRTPVTGDPATITLYIVFITIYLAFLIIFPGIRKDRITTFLSVSLSLFVGYVILICNISNGWHVANKSISASYRAFSKDKIYAQLGVHVGLMSMNVTLEALPIHNGSEAIYFNERFWWRGPTEMRDSYRKALSKGLPYPILTVAEYFSVDQEGFCWGRSYRSAGYYANIILWSAFALWCVMNILLVVVPRYGAYAFTWVGILMLTAAYVYYYRLPSTPLAIPFQGVIVDLSLGWCWWLVVVAGSVSIFCGLMVSIVDWIFPHMFTTSLEVDYGTPYDRHIIIEENDRSKRKARLPRPLEEPLELGSRIWRRMSRRRNTDKQDEEGRYGADNQAFEMDPPKSPWRYPQYLHTPRMDGTSAKMKANKTVSFRLRGESKPALAVPGFQHFHRPESDDSTDTSDSESGQVQIHVPEFQKPSITKSEPPTERKSSGESNGESIGIGAMYEREAGAVGGVPSEFGSSRQSFVTAISETTGQSYDTAEEDTRKLSQASDGAIYRSRKSMQHKDLLRRYSVEPLKVKDSSVW